MNLWDKVIQKDQYSKAMNLAIIGSLALVFYQLLTVNFSGAIGTSLICISLIFLRRYKSGDTYVTKTSGLLFALGLYLTLFGGSSWNLLTSIIDTRDIVSILGGLGVGLGVLGLIVSLIIWQRLPKSSRTRLATYSIISLLLGLFLLFYGKSLWDLVNERFVRLQNQSISEEDDMLIDTLLNNNLAASIAIGVGLLGLFLIGVAQVSIFGIVVRPFNELSGNARFGFGLLFALCVLYGSFIILLTPSHLAKNLVEFRRPLIANGELTIQSNLEEVTPNKYDKKTLCQRTLNITLQNEGVNVISTEAILVTLPERFFDGFFIDYERDPEAPTPTDRLTIRRFPDVGNFPTVAFPPALLSSYQSYTVTLPLKTYKTGDFSGQINVSSWMANDSYYRGYFSGMSNRTIAQVLSINPQCGE